MRRLKIGSLSGSVRRMDTPDGCAKRSIPDGCSVYRIHYCLVLRGGLATVGQICIFNSAALTSGRWRLEGQNDARRPGTGNLSVARAKMHQTWDRKLLPVVRTALWVARSSLSSENKVTSEKSRLPCSSLKFANPVGPVQSTLQWTDGWG